MVGFPTLPAYTSAGDFFFQKPQDALPVPDHGAVVNTATLQQITVGPPMSVGTGAAAGAVGGVMGALIQSKAEETQKKAMGSHEEVKQRVPGIRFSEDFVDEVRRGLEAQGIRVKLAPAQFPVRARWPVPEENGIRFETQPGDPPPTDSDLYVQITPRAVLTAPGPLNAYFPAAAAALLVFDGRSKQLLHKQYFGAQEPGNWLSYSYGGLLEHPEKPIADLRRLLLGLAPQVVHVISAKPGDPPKP